jgi:hypothetical protein
MDKPDIDTGRTACDDTGTTHKEAPPSALTPSEAKEHGDMSTALPSETLKERPGSVKTTHAVQLTDAELQFLRFLVGLAVKSCS